MGTVNQASCKEIRIQDERLFFQVSDRGIYQFVEIVREDLRGQTHGDAFGTLGQ